MGSAFASSSRIASSSSLSRTPFLFFSYFASGSAVGFEIALATGAAGSCLAAELTRSRMRADFSREERKRFGNISEGEFTVRRLFDEGLYWGRNIIRRLETPS